MQVKWSESRSVVSNSLQPHGLYSPWDSLGQNTGVGSLSLLQGIFPTQGSNLQADSLPLSHLGSPTYVIKFKVKVKVTQSCPTLCNPMNYTVHGILQARILEWVAFPFSRGSSQARNQTQVFRNAGTLFTSWAARELKLNPHNYSIRYLQVPFYWPNWNLKR